MGRKQSGARQLVYVFSAGLILSILLGCFPEARRIAVQKDPAIANFQEEHHAGNNPWKALQRAQKLFREGDYDASFRENQKALEWAGGHFPADRALFHMGLIYAHGANPKKDLRESLGFFRRVGEEFPQSLLAEESRVWIGLLQKNTALIQENARLSQMAERHRLQEETVLSARDHFHRARDFFEQGNFEAALEENQKVLSTPGKNSSKDRALFQIGLIYASSRNPKRDLDKSLSFFLKLVKEYPQSPFTDEAKTWIDVLQENQKLNRMIEKSKEVDIAIEEKKREKGR